MPAGVTQKDIWKAAEALVKKDKVPTVINIRSQLGGGNPQTIASHLTDWKVEYMEERMQFCTQWEALTIIQEEIEQERAEFIREIEKLDTKLDQSKKELATKTQSQPSPAFQQQLKDAQEKARKLEEGNKKLEGENKRLEETSRKREGENRRLEESNKRLEGGSRKLEDSNKRLGEENKRLQTEIATLKQRAAQTDDLKRQIDKLKEELANLAKAAAAAKQETKADARSPQAAKPEETPKADPGAKPQAGKQDFHKSPASSSSTRPAQDAGKSKTNDFKKRS